MEKFRLGLDLVVKILITRPHRRSPRVIIGAPDTGLQGGNEAA